jgi:GTP cyclohydrolase I
MKAADKKKIERAVKLILEAIGEDPNREGLIETPSRVARMYEEFFNGRRFSDIDDLRRTLFAEKYQELVLLRDVPFFSICEHHLLPFVGVAHIAYIPKGKITGLSKVGRAFDELCRRPQVQERLTSQMADLLMESLNPRGAAVILEARHMCIEIRGVKKPGTIAVTSALRGCFITQQKTRLELMSLLGRK